MTNKILPMFGNAQVDSELQVVDYVAGRLSEDDRIRFEAALDGDEHLSNKVRAERKLRQGILDAVPAQAPSAAAFARLKQQLSEEATPSVPQRQHWWQPYAIAASVMAAAFLLATTVKLTNPSDTGISAEFTTLSSEVAAPIENTRRYRVIFSPEIQPSEQEVTARALGMQLVDGDGPAGTRVAIAPEALDREMLESLRADPRILFVEPIRYVSPE